MKIEFERFHFAEGVVEKVDREIDPAAVLSGNALFQKLSKERDERKPKRS